MRTIVITLVAMVAMTSVGAISQSPDSALAFDAASIKRSQSAPGAATGVLNQPGGRLVATNATLRLLIRAAYQRQSFQIVEGPVWLDTDHFDIQARGDATATPAQMRSMLQMLLVTRFHLVVHSNQREMPIFYLVVAKTNGALGPQMHVATQDCATRPPSPGIPPPPGGGGGCGIGGGRGRVSGRGVTTAQIATSLSATLNTIVQDQTGLTGTYDLDLTWTPDAPAGVSAPIDGPTIFAAMPEQLGLKLEPAKASIDVLVVDGAAPPRED